MGILIKNGTIVTSTQTYNSDIFLENGKIAHIGDGTKNIGVIDRVVEAQGCYVFPGGIDPHVHMNLPTPAGYSADDFVTGSRAALLGGTTTLIDFVTPRKGQALTEALQERKAEAENAYCDYSFHVSPVEWTSFTEKEILNCINSGITSFKVYMAYKESVGLNDDDILKVMKVVARVGGIVTLHCELGDEIELLRNELAENGNIEPEFHPLSRPSGMEAVAVRKAIEMGAQADCPVYIVHTSCGESIKFIKEAQEIGQKVYSETCPQYLVLDDSTYKGDFSETSKFVMSPPLRKVEDQQILWDALNKGIVKTIGTDHCPFNLEQKKLGIDDFRKIPNGAGGVEHRLKLLFTYGVLRDRINLNQFVDFTSTQPAKIFGLYPQKGGIAIGSDADIVIWNPESRSLISAETHYQNCDLEIYEGMETIGTPEIVISKGEIVVERGELILKSKGRFLKRGIA